jgi:Polycystin domain/Ankyrin repeats (3 copies)
MAEAKLHVVQTIHALTSETLYCCNQFFHPQNELKDAASSNSTSPPIIDHSQHLALTPEYVYWSNLCQRILALTNSRVPSSTAGPGSTSTSPSTSEQAPELNPPPLVREQMVKSAFFSSEPQTEQHRRLLIGNLEKSRNLWRELASTNAGQSQSLDSFRSKLRIFEDNICSAMSELVGTNDGYSRATSVAQQHSPSLSFMFPQQHQRIDDPSHRHHPDNVDARLFWFRFFGFDTTRASIPMPRFIAALDIHLHQEHNERGLSSELLAQCLGAVIDKEGTGDVEMHEWVDFVYRFGPLKGCFTRVQGVTTPNGKLAPWFHFVERSEAERLLASATLNGDSQMDGRDAAMFPFLFRHGQTRAQSAFKLSFVRDFNDSHHTSDRMQHSLVSVVQVDSAGGPERRYCISGADYQQFDTLRDVCLYSLEILCPSPESEYNIAYKFVQEELKCWNSTMIRVNNLEWSNATHLRALKSFFSLSDSVVPRIRGVDLGLVAELQSMLSEADDQTFYHSLEALVKRAESHSNDKVRDVNIALQEYREGQLGFAHLVVERAIKTGTLDDLLVRLCRLGVMDCAVDTTWHPSLLPVHHAVLYSGIYSAPSSSSSSFSPHVRTVGPDSQSPQQCLHRVVQLLLEHVQYQDKDSVLQNLCAVCVDTLNIDMLADLLQGRVRGAEDVPNILMFAVLDPHKPTLLHSIADRHPALDIAVVQAQMTLVDSNTSADNKLREPQHQPSGDGGSGGGRAILDRAVSRMYQGASEEVVAPREKLLSNIVKLVFSTLFPQHSDNKSSSSLAAVAATTNTTAPAAPSVRLSVADDRERISRVAMQTQLARRDRTDEEVQRYLKGLTRRDFVESRCMYRPNSPASALFANQQCTAAMIACAAANKAVMRALDDEHARFDGVASETKETALHHLIRNHHLIFSLDDFKTVLKSYSAAAGRSLRSRINRINASNSSGETPLSLLLDQIQQRNRAADKLGTWLLYLLQHGASYSVLCESSERHSASMHSRSTNSAMILFRDLIVDRMKWSLSTRWEVLRNAVRFGDVQLVRLLLSRRVQREVLPLVVRPFFENTPRLRHLRKFPPAFVQQPYTTAIATADSASSPTHAAAAAPVVDSYRFEDRHSGPRDSDEGLLHIAVCSERQNLEIIRMIIEETPSEARVLDIVAHLPDRVQSEGMATTDSATGSIRRRRRSLHDIFPLTGWNSDKQQNEMLRNFYLRHCVLNINFVDYFGRTALHLATNFSQATVTNSRVIQLLVRHKTNIIVQDCYGWTALHYACAHHQLGIVSKLIEAHVDTEVRTGYTPTGRDAIADEELCNGSVNMIGGGQTALHIASTVGFWQGVNALCIANAKVEAMDHVGQTPLAISLRKQSSIDDEGDKLLRKIKNSQAPKPVRSSNSSMPSNNGTDDSKAPFTHTVAVSSTLRRRSSPEPSMTIGVVNPDSDSVELQVLGHSPETKHDLSSQERDRKVAFAGDDSSVPTLTSAKSASPGSPTTYQYPDYTRSLTDFFKHEHKQLNREVVASHEFVKKRFELTTKVLLNNGASLQATVESLPKSFVNDMRFDKEFNALYSEVCKFDSKISDIEAKQQIKKRHQYLCGCIPRSSCCTHTHNDDCDDSGPYEPDKSKSEMKQEAALLALQQHRQMRFANARNQFVIQYEYDRAVRFFHKMRALRYIVLLILLTVVGIHESTRDAKAGHFVNEAINTKLVQDEFDYDVSKLFRTFPGIDAKSEWYQWARGPLLDLVYPAKTPTYWQSGVSSPLPRGPGYIAEQIRLVGTVRLRQQRSRVDSCDVNPSKLNAIATLCFTDAWNEQDKSAYTISDSSRQHGFSFEHNDAEMWTWGRAAWYREGGYTLQMPWPSDTNARNNASDILSFLENANWIDAATRVVFVEMTGFNPNENFFVYIKMTVEFPLTGGIVPSSTISVTKLYKYTKNDDIALFVAELLVVLLMSLHIWSEIGQVCVLKSEYFKSFYNWIDSFMVAGSCSVFVLHCINYAWALDVDWNATDRFVSTSQLDFFTRLESTLISFIVLFAWIKLLDYMAVIERISRLIVMIEMVM